MTSQSDLERDVRQTLTAAAQTQFPAASIDRLLEAGRTRRGSVPAIRRRASRRWIAPVLAAAAVIALAVGLVATQGDDSHPPVQHHTTAPPVATSTAPIPSPSATSPSTTGPSTSSTKTAPTVTTKELTVHVGSQRFVLTVPLSWQLSQTQPKSCCDTPPTACLVSGRADWANDPDNCVLAITWIPDTGEARDPDFPLPYPDATCRSWVTTQDSSTDIQGRPGQFRAFTNKCTDVKSEMWMTMSGPQIAFWHPISAVSSHATVAAVIASAVLPAVSDPRDRFDEGYVTDVSRAGTTYSVTIDRVVVSLDGSVINTKSTTYTYPVSGQVYWRHGFALDGLSLAQFLTQFGLGPHPGNSLPTVDGAYVQIVTPAANVAYNVSICPIPTLSDAGC